MIRTQPPITPIEIQIQNSHKFAVTAFFLDRPQVMQAIADARIELGMTNLDSQEKPNRELLEKSANDLLHLYPMPIGFDNLMINAIQSGTVSEQDFQTISTWVIDGKPHSEPRQDTLPGVYLAIHPVTTIGEIESFLQTQYPNIKITLEKIANQTNLPTIKGTENSQRDRKWYWEYVYGKSADQIAEKYQSSQGIQTNQKKTVEEAIKRYHERLTWNN